MVRTAIERFVLAALMSLAAGTARAEATLEFPRHPAPSPDGSEIAFSWQGDIWVVDSIGGLARRITAHPGYDSHPIWSGAGELLAYTSDRNGNDDVFIVPSAGGTTKRLTYYSGDDVACDFIYEDRAVLLISARDHSEFRMPSLYAVSIDGGTPHSVSAAVSDGATVLDDGSLVFMHGTRSAPWWRRGYSGAGAGSLWRSDGRTVEPFFQSDHRDLQPSWSSALDKVVFLSEASGTFNVHMSDGISSAAVTTFDDDGVRFPRVAGNAPLIAFERGLSIWTVVPGESPRPIDIRGHSDAAHEAVERIDVRKADEYAVSPDGKEIAIVHRGDIFVRRGDQDSPELVQVTRSPARDHDIAWSPDSKSLVFVSDRSGSFDLYIATADGDEERLVRTRTHAITRLSQSAADVRDPAFSHDGESVAFVRGLGELVVIRADGGSERRRARGSDIPEFAWSPDDRWLAFSRWDDDFNLDIHVVAAEPGDEPDVDDLFDVEIDGDGAVNVTRHPGEESRPTWSADGRKLAFVGERAFFTQSDIWYTWLRREDEEKTTRSVLDEALWTDSDEDEEDDENEDTETTVDIDFDEIHRRHHRVTRLAGRETNVVLSSDGTWIAYVAEGDEGRDIWRVRWDGKEKKRLTKGGTNPSALSWHEKSKSIYFLAAGTLKRVKIDGGDVDAFPVSGSTNVDRGSERLQMFDEAWRVLDAGFYDPDHHGADWPATRERYRAYAAAAAHPQDFVDSVRLMLGELNSSHQNFWGPSRTDPTIPTGHLGVVAVPDEQGIRVIQVLPISPASRVSSRLMEGDIITGIDGRDVGLNDNLYEHLYDRVEKDVTLTVKRHRRTLEVTIRPYGRSAYRSSVWERDRRIRRSRVDDLSNGRLGYINLRHMGSASVDQFETELYAVANGKDALVIDVRDNSGGWVTDILLHSLLAGDHAITVPRGGGPGYPAPRRLIYAWTKPIIVLCNPSTFSNGEIFAWSIQTLGRGKVVGQPTFGGVISTGARRLLDGSRVRRPFRGWYVNRGGSNPLDGRINMELQGCVPDILVDMPPDAWRSFEDPQLDRAVAELMGEL